MSASVYIEAAALEDVEALVALERRCFSHPWTPGNFRDAMRNPERGRVLVLRAAGAASPTQPELAGYCVFETVAGELHVHNVAIDPAHRRRGLGRALMELTLALGQRRGARTALLEVRRSNEHALRLYATLGFRVVATRRGYYSHPEEDALVLEKIL